jgi:hypothetical protein
MFSVCGSVLWQLSAVKITFRDDDDSDDDNHDSMMMVVMVVVMMMIKRRGVWACVANVNPQGATAQRGTQQ